MEIPLQDMVIDTGAYKRNKTNLFDNGSNMYKGEEGGNRATSNKVTVEFNNYQKFTMAKLKHEMTEAGFGAQILAIRKPSKKDLLELYAKVMPLRRSSELNRFCEFWLSKTSRASASQGIAEAIIKDGGFQMALVLGNKRLGEEAQVVIPEEPNF